MSFLDHITSDPNLCHGKPCFRGALVIISRTGTPARRPPAEWA